MKFIDLDYNHLLIKKKLNSKFTKIFNHKKFILGPEVSDLELKLSNYVKISQKFFPNLRTDQQNY